VGEERPVSAFDDIPVWIPRGNSAALFLTLALCFGQGSRVLAESGERSLPEILEPDHGPRYVDKAAFADQDYPHWRKNLFKRVASDQKYLFTTWLPIEIRRPEFVYPLVGATVAAVGSNAARPGLDPHASQIQYLGSGAAQGASETVSVLGDGGMAAALVGGTYLVSRWSGNTRMARASSLSAEALANTAIWSTLLKKVARRARPDSTTQAGMFLVNDASVEATSFPSGHTMVAFAVAAVFAGEFRDKKWVPWVAYGIASLVGASRVALGRHYLSDVIVGGTLGHSLGKMVLAREYGARDQGVFERFQPTVEPETQRYGLTYRYSW
jgi:hypothetical protein